MKRDAGRGVYGSLALIFLNSCLLLVVANVALFLVFRFLDGRRAQPATDSRSAETLSQHGVVHPGLDREQIRDLWEETYLASSGFVYEPYTQFKIEPFAGRYVTVDEHGFRRHPQNGPWPATRDALNIFLFGGSTAFGYGVPDDQTIAAHLERYLAEPDAAGAERHPVRVYNFGRSGYFSTQERLLFEQLLSVGAPVDVAVFLDGLNDSRIGDNVPIFTRRLSRQFEVRDVAVRSVLARLPMMRLARAVAGRDRRPPAAAGPAEPESVVAARTADNYLANKGLIEAVSAAYGVTPLFVWQPVSFYGYDRRHHLFGDSSEPPHVEAGYEHMAGIAGQGQLGEQFLWLADMQIGVEEPLYVDQAHYSGAMSRRIAERIGEWLVHSGVLARGSDASR